MKALMPCGGVGDESRRALAKGDPQTAASKGFNHDNRKRKYATLDKRVKETYSDNSTAQASVSSCSLTGWFTRTTNCSALTSAGILP